MTTIREVAQKAGVSFTTVSHVINNSRFVTESTRQRVLVAMQELDYQPNDLARSLRSGKTNTLGLILPDSSNPYFAEVGRSIEMAAYHLGYSVILCNTEGEPDKENFYVQVLSNKRVDGVIFVASGDQVESVNFLLQREMPVVVVDRDLQNVQVDAVLTDNQQGGMIACQHLLELGHRRIACVTGPSNLTPSAERVTGYRRALQEAGIPYNDSLVLRGDYHPESGLQNTLTLLNLPDPPTAIIACNDLMALGALRAASMVGLQVPNDLAVCGYDDIELACYTNPPLTTIAQPKEEIGYQAANVLVRRITDDGQSTQRMVLPTKIIVRGSTKLEAG